MFKTLIGGAVAVALFAAPALAHEYKLGSLTVGHPWARATPKGAQIGGGYLSVTNNGKEADRLLGGSTPAADKLELHETSTENGISRMRPVTGGIEIKPGETLTLKPGGYHFMLVNLKEPLKQGTRVPATLDFAKAGKVKVEFAVEGIGAMGDKHGAMPGMNH